MKTRIVLADDHTLMREGLHTLINEQPNLLVVAEAEDGASAAKAVSELAPHIVIMDVSMPGVNGIEATRRIVQANDPPRVIALSMHLDRRLVLEMLGAGAAGYLLKDCAFDEVIQAIAIVAGGGTYLSPQVQDLLVKEHALRCAKGRVLPADAGSAAGEVSAMVLAGRSAREIAAALGLTDEEAEQSRMRIISDQVVPALLRACVRQPGAERGTGEQLTLREREVLQWIKEGKSSWEIASILGISQDTVKFHLKKVYGKLNAGNRPQAIAVALERKLID